MTDLHTTAEVLCEIRRRFVQLRITQAKIDAAKSIGEIKTIVSALDDGDVRRLALSLAMQRYHNRR
jgi:hypothetical protein